jgi:hypothetical protein
MSLKCLSLFVKKGILVRVFGQRYKIVTQVTVWSVTAASVWLGFLKFVSES